MATTQTTYTGNGSTTNYSFTFEYLKQADVKVTLNSVTTTAFTFANATTLSFNTAPANGAAIRIFRDTASDNLNSTFFPGSAIKAEDLNENFTQNLYVTQESDAEAASATTTANGAVTTANGAVTTANNAVTTANSAETKSDAAVATANTSNTNSTAAVATANTASSNATTAVNTANTATTTANSAVTTANAATATANGAVTTANAATATANTASTNASAAVTTANTANTNSNSAVTSANSAVATANTANTTAASAVTTANGAVTTANTADTNATAAVNTANAASTAVSNAVLFTLIANVAAIPGSPSNDDYVEIGNSTGIESFSPLSGLPSGFVGASGLTVRLRYETSSTSWVFMNYFANDSETRYVAIGNPNPTYYANQAAFPSATDYHGAVAHSHADGAMYYAHGGNWIEMAKDSDVTTNATAIGTKLPLAGGTLTGDLTLSGNPTAANHAANKSYVDTEVAGIVSSAPATLDTLNELAAALGDDPNFATTVTNSIATKLPLAGGTLTGGLTGTTGAFSGDVQLAGNAKAGVAGIKLEASGLISAARAGNGTAVFGGYTAGNATATSSILNDGSASFAASNVNVNKVTNGANFNIRNDSTSAEEVLGVYKSGFTSSDRTVEIKNDGSATFAGVGTFSGDLRVQDGGNFRVRTAADSASDAILLQNNGNITASGSATFAGSMTVSGTGQYSDAQRGDVYTMTGAGGFSIDWNNSNNYQFNLTGTTTLNNPTNQVAGQHGVIRIVQDSTGGRTLAFGSNWKFPGGTAPTISTAANAQDLLAYYVAASGTILAQLITDLK